jgi:putative protease
MTGNRPKAVRKAVTTEKRSAGERAAASGGAAHRAEPGQQGDGRPELLAPAGSLESFFAAMERGADAVYAGLRDFSARARAKNFTPAQMERMLAYAHAHGRRVYITLNTLVKEKELPQLVETLAALAEMRADGVIVQDLAVARLVRKHFPSVPLHASTQMTIHNIPGVQILHELGFRRAVLARELALDEVAAIASATPVEIETFIHGALCFSISGQCFFSSSLGGHSGNRGRCAQPCRRQYDHRGRQGHYFSTNDLSAIDLVPDLAAAGVASLKIEGRMRSAEYVATVVQAYRMVLDAPDRTRAEALKEAKELLKYSFGRSPTRGFLGSRQPDDIVNPWQKGGTGRFVGRITAMNGSRLSFECRDAIHVGDRLRVQPGSDMAGQAWTVRELFTGRRKVMEARAGSLVEVETPFRFSTGDAVYKVSSCGAFTLSEGACQRRLEGVRGDRLPCRLRVSLEQLPSGGALSPSLPLRVREPASSPHHEFNPSPQRGEGGSGDGFTLRISAEVAGSCHEFRFPLGPLEPARSADMEGVLRGQFSRTGETPFYLESLEAPGFPPVLIPAALFKELRRQLYRQLAEAVTARFREGIAAARAAALRDTGSQAHAGAPRRLAAGETLTVLIDLPKEWRFPLQQGADSVIIPLSRAAIHQLGATLPRMRGFEGRIIWQLPFIILDRDLPLYRETVQQLHASGFYRFEAANLSHFHLLRPLKGVHISAWYRCFSLNSQAVAAWRELGAECVTLYLEDDAANLADLLGSGDDPERRMVVYGPLPVMTTMIRMKDVHTNIPLHSDRGEAYSVTTRDGLQTITAAAPFSLTARHGELRSRGCASFVIDLQQARRETWSDIIAAFKAGREIPGTTEFNYATELV